MGSDPALLSALACWTAAIAIATYRFEPELARGAIWLRRGAPRAIAAGCAAATLIAAPVLAQSWSTPVAARGGGLAASSLAALFVFSMIGNAYEELLFRGFLQGSLEPRLGPTRAACVAGVSFGFGHVLLSATVTDLGVPVLLFTLYEGLICAFLCRDFRLVASTIAHGGGIFLIASGI